MIYVSVTYHSSINFDSPDDWFRRTAAYVGILECLSRDNTVINIKRINYQGNVVHKGIDYRFLNIGKRDTYFPFKLNTYIKNLKPDVVLVQGLHVPLQVILLRMILGKKLRSSHKTMLKSHLAGSKNISSAWRIAALMPTFLPRMNWGRTG
ncbi:MAG: hypothetical protein ACXVIY_04260 [Mucilaginibacter sp.]